MLRLARFQELVAAYGGNLERWPEELRAEALELLAVSDRARALLAEARTFDETIRVARAHDDARTWSPREHGAALARLRAGVAARIAAPAEPTRPIPFKRTRFAGVGWEGTTKSPFRWFGMATLGAAVVVCGLVVGASYAPPTRSDTLFGVLQLPFYLSAD